jgi:hypothetical protein
MAFVWTPITALITEAQAAHANEIQTNVDTLADSFTPPLSHYGWTNLPVAADEEIELLHFTELKNGVDYIHTNNICSADYVTKNSSFNGTYLALDDAGALSGVLGTYNGLVNVGYSP